MPNSIRENNNDVRAFVATHPEIQTALDVGPGEGTYHTLLGDLIPAMDAIEIWEKNIEEFKLRDRYRTVWHNDIRKWNDKLYTGDFDLIIFGDVLEHMEVDEAVAVFNKALEHSKWVLVSVPIVHFPQDAIDGNKHEAHKIEDPLDDLLPVLPKPRYGWGYQYTGTFIYSGKLL